MLLVVVVVIVVGQLIDLVRFLLRLNDLIHFQMCCTNGIHNLRIGTIAFDLL